jgi:hypothetical protein
VKRRFELPFLFLLAMSLAAMAPPPGEAGHANGARPQETRPANPPRANQGRVPPPPSAHDAHAKPEPENRENGKIHASQQVNHDYWYGHDASNEKRFHLDDPFEHGPFERFGANFRYAVIKIDRDHPHFWYPGGFYFAAASWDCFSCSDWCWDYGDDFVVFENTDPPERYLRYDVHNGVYVHATYLRT